MNDPRFAPVRFPAALADEDVAAILDFLHDLATAFENHYAGQLYRYYHGFDQRQARLWDDDNPPF